MKEKDFGDFNWGAVKLSALLSFVFGLQGFYNLELAFQAFESPGGKGGKERGEKGGRERRRRREKEGKKGREGGRECYRKGEDGIREHLWSRGLGEVYKRKGSHPTSGSLC